MLLLLLLLCVGPQRNKAHTTNNPQLFIQTNRNKQHTTNKPTGKALLAPYLPREGGGGGGSPYSEGGALYALGLITANHGALQRDFLLTSLRAASGPVTQHGACLGLGLACLGAAADDEAFEDLKGALYTDDAVAGEAAGLAMGLLLCGSASDKAQEMLAYAHDTAHEKIIRGLALGLALTAYGREEGADALVEQMARDQDPILRWGAAHAVGLAYRGTGHNGAIARLLHTAVTDVSDDVRRAAVMCLGFVLLGSPEQCPRIVALLAESFNPHVRYGAAMAVGIACAASGGREAVALLEAMAGDSVDFVRQGVYIALALVQLQQPEARVEPLRKRLAKAVADKHEETMARMGAAIATGACASSCLFLPLPPLISSLPGSNFYCCALQTLISPLSSLSTSASLFTPPPPSTPQPN